MTTVEDAPAIVPAPERRVRILERPRATTGKFKMPNLKLPKLPSPSDRAGFIALQQKKPDAVKFMGTVVKPKMAELLGVLEWTPKTPTGFGCYQCHTND